MRTVAIFKNGNNQAIRLPKDFEFNGISELIITKDGESIILTPKRKSWDSFFAGGKADEDFLTDRPDIIEDGRVKF